MPMQRPWMDFSKLQIVALAGAAGGLLLFMVKQRQTSRQLRDHSSSDQTNWSADRVQIERILSIRRDLQESLDKKTPLYNCPHLQEGVFFYEPSMIPKTSADMASFIDHTVLSPGATRADVEKMCGEAQTHCFFAVCVNGCNLDTCAGVLADVPVGVRPNVAAVVGFPLGACTTATKAFEAGQAIELGATEIDMVINIGKLKAGEFQCVFDDIRAVARTCEAGGGALKVILECGLLSDDEIVRACLLCVSANVAFVKTSTGFLAGGAQVPHVRLMRTVVGDACKIKASGGIGDWGKAQQMIVCGANRIGASKGVSIINSHVESPESSAY